jgi:hypothetical protein
MIDTMMIQDSVVTSNGLAPSGTNLTGAWARPGGMEVGFAPARSRIA